MEIITFTAELYVKNKEYIDYSDFRIIFNTKLNE